MALEQLSLARPPVDGNVNAASLSNGVVGRQVSVDGGDDGNRAPRLPRWTRQDILVLIQGKKVAENRVRRGRTAGSAFGSNQLEPKWASVSSYCKLHGVNRGPVQCRKRWSNLAGDYKKIKEWDSQIREESESFWVMRNDLRRERKLPGFFDREVYDILDGGAVTAPSPVTLRDTTDVKEEDDAVFDSVRSAAAEDGLFSDFEQSGQEDAGGSPEKEAVAKENPTATVPAPLLISERQYQPLCKGYLDQGVNTMRAVMVRALARVRDRVQSGGLWILMWSYTSSTQDVYDLKAGRPDTCARYVLEARLRTTTSWRQDVYTKLVYGDRSLTPH